MARILLAEDIEPARAAMALVLETAGHDVVCCSDGEEAIELCEVQQFDLAVVDIWMPRRSGLDVLKALRGKSDNIPVILASGGGPGASLEQATALADLYGATAVLYKPVEDEELLAAVDKALA